MPIRSALPTYPARWAVRLGTAQATAPAATTRYSGSSRFDDDPPTAIGMRNGIVATTAIGNAVGSRAKTAASAATSARPSTPAATRERRMVAQRAHLVAVGDVHEQDRRREQERAEQQPRTRTVAAHDERAGGERGAEDQRASRSHVRPMSP